MNEGPGHARRGGQRGGQGFEGARKLARQRDAPPAPTAPLPREPLALLCSQLQALVHAYHLPLLLYTHLTRVVTTDDGMWILCHMCRAGNEGYNEL